MTSALPGGTVTFLFTDIEGSTPLWEREPERMRLALAQHDAILRQAVAAHQGHLFKTIGDAIQAAFALPADALAAALTAQRQLTAAVWPTSAPLPVRMGLHTGPAEPDGADYTANHTLNRVARIMAAAHGGQVVLSAEVAELSQGGLPPDSTLRDLGQHRMKGMTQREHLFQLLAPGLPARFPPLATLDAIPNNLPVQLTSFVGRVTEIAQTHRLLAETHLLTLTGSGGTGKTRLSLQAAAGLLPNFADGAWLVELAPLVDPALVPRAMAATLGVREQTDRPVVETLTDFLRAKQLLLILDNCEHVLAVCAETADSLLRQCPRLKILVSSREALGIAGETTYPVPSLSLPDAPGELDPAQLAKSEAVRLFVERAQAVLPSFTLTAANASAVAHICRRLDGIPLALELAAARVKMMSVDEIARRLDDRFRLLTAGSRTALPRQQTLRALIDWSYALLSEPERVLFRRLAVFAGGFDLAAAETVAAGDPIDAGQVVDLLGQLINKSLVNVDDPAYAGSRAQDGAAGTRYRMLETILEYARQKLEAASEAEDSRARHLAFFCALAESAGDGIYSDQQTAWFRRLDRELDNLRAALSWRLAADAPLAHTYLKQQLLIIGALTTYWERVAMQREISQALAGLLARDDPAAPSRERARALCTGGYMLWSSNQLAAARDSLAESVHIAEALNDRLTLVFSLGFLGWTLDYLGDYDAARITLERSVALGRTLGDPGQHAIGMPLSLLGDLPYQQGDWPAARRLYEEAIAYIRQIHNQNFLTYPLRRLAYVDLHVGRLEQAAAGFGESLALNRELDHAQGQCACLAGFANLCLAQGRLEAAAALCAFVEAQLQRLGLPLYMADSKELERCMAQVRAALAPAAAAAAWAAGRALTLDEAMLAARASVRSVSLA